MIRVVIVDDEAPARERLKQILEDIDGYVCVDVAANGDEALRVAAIERPDILLLDIRMPGLSGLEVARHLNSLESPPAVVFTTAYDEYAIQAFEARAVGYVLKPVRRSRLEGALQQAARLRPAALDAVAQAPGMEAARSHLCARRQGVLRLIPIDDVDYFEAEQKYVTVHHAGGEDIINESLKSLEAEFAGRFIRIHRSVLAAVNSISRIERDADGRARAVLKIGSQEDAKALIISRRHVADVKRRLLGGT